MYLHNYVRYTIDNQTYLLRVYFIHLLLLLKTLPSTVSSGMRILYEKKKSTNICLAFTNICHVWVSNALASSCDYRVNLSPNCVYIYILMLCKIITNIAFSLIPDRPEHSVPPSGSRRSTRHSNRFTRLRRSQRYQHV